MMFISSGSPYFQKENIISKIRFKLVKHQISYLVEFRTESGAANRPGKRKLIYMRFSHRSLSRSSESSANWQLSDIFVTLQCQSLLILKKVEL